MRDYRAALLLTTLSLLAVAVLATRHFSSRWQTGGEALAPQLQKQLETVREITLRDAPSGATSRVRWDDSRWVVGDPTGYPADREHVTALLESLVEMRLIEEKSRRAEDYGKLGLSDIDADGSRARLLRIVDDDGVALLELLVGERSALRTGHFLRRPGTSQSWLGDRELALPPPNSGWLQTTIVDLPYSRVASLRIIDAAGGQWTLERDSVDEGNLRLVEQPEFMRLRYAGALNAYGNLLQGLRLEGVEAAGQPLPEPQWRLDFTLRNGLRASASLRHDGDTPQLWLDFSAGEEGAEEAKAEAEQLQARHAPWLYYLSDYTYDRFQFRLEDVLEPQPEAQAPTADDVEASATGGKTPR